MYTREKGPHICIDFYDFEGNPRHFHFLNPVDIISTNSIDNIKECLQKVEQSTKNGAYAVGYVAYEAAPAFESAFSVRSDLDLPLLWFGVFDGYTTTYKPVNGKFKVSEWHSLIDRESYASNISTIREAIARGDTYQVNYTIRLRSTFEGDDFAFYQHLSNAQQASYCAYMNIGKYCIISISPELFFHKTPDHIVTKPMKGTIRRGRWIEEDEANLHILRHSIKDQAENLMIVDLLRNDLGRIAKVGSVAVDKLFDIEKYRTVFQMTSTITAALKPDTSLTDIFSALFPCGSITGAPKISTMKLISSLESSPRGVYCGSIGLVTPENEAMFNVAIRTICIDRSSGFAEFGVGGGITWDSTPTGEYDEILSKSAFLRESWPDFNLLETILLDSGDYFLIDRHLLRLQASARYFGFAMNMEEIRRRLKSNAVTRPDGSWRVRLLLSENGDVVIENFLITDAQEMISACLADKPISRFNRFFYHKTTNRDIYDDFVSGRTGFDEVLLWNENDELTEFTKGNIVVEIDGHKFTPPVESGLLAGTFRSELLNSNQITERVLKKSDIGKFSQVWLINSVRKFVRVQLLLRDCLKGGV